jgi:hypothetical protein
VVTESATNVATFISRNDSQQAATAQAEATVTALLPEPAIALIKTVGTEAAECATTNTISVETGTTVYYCFTVTNIGDVTFTTHDLVDSELGQILTDEAVDLAPGESLSFPGNAFVVSETVTNTATFTSSNDEGKSATAEASATVTALVSEPAISLVKTVGTELGVCATTSELSVDAGTTVYYCYTVTNIGNVTFTTHDLVDSVLGPVLSDVVADLAPGESLSYASSGFVVNNAVTNTATFTSTDPDGRSASAEASASVSINQAPSVPVTGADSDVAALFGVMLAVLGMIPLVVVELLRIRRTG